ncbi:peptidoglycan DD-metalloendopeptidase family protein [Mariniluteicoccus flavus]
MALKQARRAAHAGPRRAVSHVVDTAEDTTTTLVKHALAAAAVSALGLGLVGSISLTAAAQSVETSASTAARGASPDATQAVPEAVQQRAQEAAIPPEEKAQHDTPQADGALEAFSRAAADGASRNAVRAEIDRAVASQKARERGASLTLSNQRSNESSGTAIQDARSTELNNTKEAAKREQARLAEEKRKTEELIKQGKLPTNNGPAAPAAPAPGLPAPAAGPAPAVSPGGAVQPMASYSRGAGWGAVGSWSRYHTGIDLSAPIGTQIRAVSSGIVVSPNAGGWAGNHVIVRHGDGTYTLYAHMSHAAVRPGQTVAAGQPVGAVGMTGRTFGPHLHFEHYPASGQTSNPYSSDDPYRWMLSQGVRL